MPAISKSASLRIISNQECDAAQTINVTETMFCGQGNQVTACRGDSGSPAVCYDGGNASPILCGITSWGGPPSDCSRNHNVTFAPTGFAKVSVVTEWISATMRAEFLQSIGCATISSWFEGMSDAIMWKIVRMSRMSWVA